jgi:putative tricarboxylic transport membrane protein
MKINDAVFGVLLLLAGVVVIVHVQSFPKIPGQQVGPALFPGLVAAGFVVCGALLVLSGIKARRAGEDAPWLRVGDWVRSPGHALAFAVIVAGVAAYVLFANAIGFLVIAPLLLASWLLVLGVRPLPAIATAIVGSLVIWYAFYKLLRVPLPWGVLTNYAF